MTTDAAARWRAAAGMLSAASLVGLLAGACGDPPRSAPPYLDYVARGLDESRADEAETLARRFANDWDLILYQSPTGFGPERGFYLYFFHDEQDLEEHSPLLLLSADRNRDKPTYLVGLMFFRERRGVPVGMPLGDLDRFAWDLKNALEERFGLAFCRTNPAISLCDSEYEALEAEREAEMRARYAGTASRTGGSAAGEAGNGSPGCPPTERDDAA